MKYVEDTEFPQIFADVALLQARDAALQGLFFQFLKDKYPADFDNYFASYESLVSKKFQHFLHLIPNIDDELREKIRRELGL